MTWWYDITAGAVLITLSNLAVFGAAVIGFIKVFKGVEKVHVLVNSQLSEFKDLLVKSAHAEGVLEGKADKPAEPAQVELVKAIPIEIKKP